MWRRCEVRRETDDNHAWMAGFHKGRGHFSVTQAEREEHERTHIPHRLWCDSCVKARGRRMAHRSRSETDKMYEDGYPRAGSRRRLLGWPNASPVAAVHWELGIGDALHLALERAFSLFGRLCAVDHASPRPPITATVFRLSSSALGSWSHWCASALHSFSIPLPAHMGISPGSPPSSLHRWLSREVNPRLHRSLRHRLSAMVSDLHGVLVNTLSDNFLPVRENPVYSFNLPPSAFRLWGLARWGHDPSSTGRPSRHLQGHSSCSFCHDTDGSLMHHLSTCPSHHNARTAWAHSCGISPPDVSTLARHGWVFNPVDESNSPQTIRAHIRFVGLVCERLQPPSW